MSKALPRDRPLTLPGNTGEDNPQSWRMCPKYLRRYVPRLWAGSRVKRTGRAAQPTQRTTKGPTMKLTILTALGAATVCAALFMGKDDIRRFIRTRNI